MLISKLTAFLARTAIARIENRHTYNLKNCKGGTAVDLSGNNNYSIIGFHFHNGSNQVWIFQQDGDQNGWFIKSSRSGKYLGIEGSPNNGTAVVVVSNPFQWDVKDSDVESAKDITRIFVHGTNFSLDLSYGNLANHTKIQLWSSWPGANQIWALTEREVLLLNSRVMITTPVSIILTPRGRRGIVNIA
ncbi:ricin B lectin domain-containing protein [Suillus subluteus]|nr:ricin B lectin domain-containing protein [Suillus subluteus]